MGIENLILDIPKRLRSGEFIKCTIDNEILDVIVYISAKDIAIKLISRDLELVGRRHIMLMAPYSYTLGIDGEQYSNEIGLKVIRELIEGLCQDFLTLKKFWSDIEESLPEYQAASVSYHAAKTIFDMKSRELKRDYKQNKISVHDYIKQFIDNKRNITIISTEYEQKYHLLFDDILTKCTTISNFKEIVERKIIEKIMSR